MQFFLGVLIINLFIFLFCIYTISKDDIILLRKDISMEKLFNLVFIGSFLCLLSSRFFYGLINSKLILSNPFVFLNFFSFPGLSLVGGVLGGCVLFLYLFVKKNKQLPLGRIADFCSIGVLITFPVGYLGYFMFSNNLSLIKAVILIFVYTILFAIFWKIFLPQLISGNIKDGTIAFLFLICFSTVSFISNIIGNFKEILTLENIILIGMFLVSIVGLVINEKLFSKFKLKR